MDDGTICVKSDQFSEFILIYEKADQGHIHTLTEHKKVNATCTKTGTEAYWSCDVCGKLFSDAEGKNEIAAPVVIPAIDLESMTVMYLPKGLKQIDAEAFSGLTCQAVIIPDGCTVIGTKAFSDCKNLVYIRIPVSCEEYDKAFVCYDLAIRSEPNNASAYIKAGPPSSGEGRAFRCRRKYRKSFIRRCHFPRCLGDKVPH